MVLPCANKKFYRLQIFACTILLFLFGAFRVDFGLDYSGYESFFNQISGSPFFEYDPNMRMEIGYSYLNYICPSFRFLIIITSLLVSITYFIVFDKYIPLEYRALAIFLLYLSGNFTIFFMFSGIRNSIAICLLILSVPLIYNRKITYYTLLTILAGSMHASAFIIFPLAYIIGFVRNINKRTLLVFGGFSVLLCLIPMSILLSLSSQFIDTNFDRYSTYINNAETIGKGASLLVSLSNLSIIFLILKNLLNIQLPRKQVLLVLLGLMAFITPLLGPLDIRLSIYFCIFSIPCIIIAYKLISVKIRKYSLLGLFIAYRGYSFFIVFLNNPYFSYSKIDNIVLGTW